MSEAKTLELISDSPSELLAKRIKAVEKRGAERKKLELVRDLESVRIELARHKFNLVEDDLDQMPQEEIEALEKAFETMAPDLQKKRRKWLIIGNSAFLFSIPAFIMAFRSIMTVSSNEATFIGMMVWAVPVVIYNASVIIGKFEDGQRLSRLLKFVSLKKQIKLLENQEAKELGDGKGVKNDE